MRRLIRLVLAGAFCAGIGSSAGSVEKSVSKIENAKLIVYYFHGTVRHLSKVRNLDAGGVDLFFCQRNQEETPGILRGEH